ncbi:MAG: chromosome segregation protein SMC, partial [Rhodobacteraceae bacterium]|nr:chromosome segregation protein SMC [Paracoccaceae bacterium]
ISQIGLAEASHLAEIMDVLKPGQRAVTRNGDLVRWDGFMVCGQETPERTALRLRQLNRLERLTSEITVSEQKKNEAAEHHNQLTAAFTEINKADQEARASRRQAEEALALANSRLSAAEAESDIAEKTLHSLKEARKRAVGEAEAARDAFAIAEQAIHQLRDVSGISSEAARLKELVVNARDQKLHMQSQMIALERAHDEREAKLADAAAEISDWEQRQEQAGQRIADLTGQYERLQGDLPQAEARPGKLAARRIALAEEILMAEEKRAAATDRLRRAENEARLTVQEASQADSDCARSLELKGRADADCANAAVKLQETVSAIQNEMNCSPDALGKKLSLDPHSLPDAGLQEIEVNRLQRSRDAIGAVNLMAEQDIVELQEEMDALQREKEDLEAAVNRLRQTIRGLNSEGRERMLTAFETVNTNFKQLFSELFNGGSARLELVEGDDPLDTGLEILCHPPGKRFSTISLLSGGEQTLTAVALIFAFFMANPAPICVLDEVDAPLDDSNVMKFCSLMEKIVQRTGTRFLVITHNPITMSHMDRLYGVTMQEKGVSKMVSVDLTEAEKLAA